MTKIIKKIASLAAGETFKFKDKIYTFSGKDGRGHCVREDGKNEHLPLNSYVTIVAVEKSYSMMPSTENAFIDSENITMTENAKKEADKDPRDLPDLNKKSDKKRVWYADSAGGIHTTEKLKSPEFPLDQLKVEDNTNEDISAAPEKEPLRGKNKELVMLDEEIVDEKESKAKTLAKKFAEMFTKNDQYDRGR